MPRSFVTEPLDCPPGFYGKLSILGDFVSRRLSRQFIDPWDEWLQHGLNASRDQLGSAWLDVYLTSPIWRFGLSPGLCGHQGWAGLLMPSVDRVGRYFPLTLATSVNDANQLFDLFEYHGDWFRRLESLALSALEANLDLEDFDLALQQLKAPLEQHESPWSFLTHGMADTESGEFFACAHRLDAHPGIARALHESGKLLLRRCLPHFTLWETMGSQHVDSTFLVVSGLPSATGFSAMLTGDWVERGWTHTVTQPRDSSVAPPLPECQPSMPSPEPSVQHGMPLDWRSHGITVVGHRRTHNEDALLELGDIGLWVVADGMGGHRAGEVASQSLVSALADLSREPPETLEALIFRVSDVIQAVNRKLCDLAATTEGNGIIGSTIVCLMARGRDCAAVWAGDSRLYRYRHGELQQLSTDHSLEETCPDSEQSVDQSGKPPPSNVITRAVGAEMELVLDQIRFQAEPGDLFLLCSDGLVKELESDEISQEFQGGSIELMADHLVSAALDKGGRDNITVIVVACPEKIHDDKTPWLPTC